MGRILAIDYGTKRVGLAVTDPLRIIARALETVHSKDILFYLENYFKAEIVDIIVVGEPKTLMNKRSDSAKFIEPFVKNLKLKFPEKKIERLDERFTSAIAKQSQIENGIKKSDRRDKASIDTISAVILLQDYLSANQRI